MSLLEEFLQPLSLEKFLNQHLFREPYAAPFAARKMAGLLNWDLLAEIFATGHRDCWLPRQGWLPEGATGGLDFSKAKDGFGQGRTILIRHSERAHPRLAEIAQDFHHLFQCEVDIQLYSTPANEEGFNWHYDAEEVFVLQSVGEKEFRLRRNTINSWPSKENMPKDLQFEKERPGPEIRCLLKAGDWLYIPSGWWHKARALTESHHLSVGVLARPQPH